MPYCPPPCSAKGKSPCGFCRADKRDGLQGCAFRCGMKSGRCCPLSKCCPPPDCCLLGYSPSCLSPICRPAGNCDGDSCCLPCDPTVLPPVGYPHGPCGVTGPIPCMSYPPSFTSGNPCSPCGPCGLSGPCDPSSLCGPCKPGDLCDPYDHSNPCMRSPYDPAKMCASCGPPCLPCGVCYQSGPDSPCLPYVPIL